MCSTQLFETLQPALVPGCKFRLDHVVRVLHQGITEAALVEGFVMREPIFFDGRSFRRHDPNGVLGKTSSFTLSLNLRYFP